MGCCLYLHLQGGASLRLRIAFGLSQALNLLQLLLCKYTADKQSQPSAITYFGMKCLLSGNSHWKFLKQKCLTSLLKKKKFLRWCGHKDSMNLLDSFWNHKKDIIIVLSLKKKQVCILRSAIVSPISFNLPVFFKKKIKSSCLYIKQENKGDHYSFYFDASVSVYSHVYRWPQRPPKGVRSSRAGITGHCELSHMYAGSQTRFPWKSSKCSEPLTHVSSPIFRSLISPIGPSVGGTAGKWWYL